MASATVLSSLQSYEKGGVEVIDADPKHYVFSNVFDVANRSKPYERVAVALNVKYTLEAVRAEGDSPWYSCAHDEAALIMDGEVEVHFVKPDVAPVADDKEGAVQLTGAPLGKNMGWVKCGVGHMALLPKGSAYQFRAASVGAMLIQSIKGDCTVEKWGEICQTRAM